MKLTLTLLGVAALILTGVAQSAQGAEAGIGQRFGAHDPRTCASQKEPSRGAPSASQAAHYFICGAESYTSSFGTGQTLVLVSDVKLDVGKGRPFNPLTDSFQNIDPSQTVYPVRASYFSYNCGPIGYLGVAAGKNCMKGEGKNLGGIMYKDAFGDWHTTLCCILGSTLQPGFAPPSKP